jgi:hypothetical protein
MTNFARRYVLKPHVGRSDVELLAWDRDWNLAAMGNEEADVYVDVWSTDDGKNEIHYVEDRPIGLNYLTLRGENLEEVDEGIRGDFEILDFSEALQTLRGAVDRDSELRAFYAVALNATEDQRELVLQQFRAAARHSDVGMRQAAVMATGYLPWPDLVALVETMRRDDPDPLVRQNAEILLEGIRRYGQE